MQLARCGPRRDQGHEQSRRGRSGVFVPQPTQVDGGQRCEHADEQHGLKLRERQQRDEQGERPPPCAPCIAAGGDQVRQTQHRGDDGERESERERILEEIGGDR